MNGPGPIPEEEGIAAAGTGDVAQAGGQWPVVVVACAPPGAEPDAQTEQTAARYIHGVERIAAAFEAEDPVVWQGDRAWLSFGNGAPEKRVRRAWRAARELWERACLGLGLPVRVGVLWSPRGVETASIADRLSRDADALFSAAPERTLVVGEEVALSLRAPDRGDFGLLGERDGEPLYFYPRDAAPAPAEGEIQDLQIWSAFQEYAQSPSVREIHYVGFRLPRRVPPVLDLLDVFVEPPGARWALARTRHIMFLGDPGAGKTTLLRWLAVVAAQHGWPFLPGEVGPKLPLLLSVGRLAKMLTTSETTPVDAIPRYFGVEDPHHAAMARFLERQLRRGRCVVLLDGLDEVRALDRSKTEAWLSDLGRQFPRNVFIATSRIVGYSGLLVAGDAAVEVLGPFDRVARIRFVKAFCRAYLRWETGEDRPEQAKAQATALLDAIELNDRLSALSQNPFMLSALALIHRAEGRLPRHRVQAYEMFLRALCETWAEARKLAPHDTGSDESPFLAYEEQAIPVLGTLALAMHERFPQGVAPTDFVRTTIADALRSREDIDEAGALAAADAFLARAGQEVQVLLERGAGQWGFLHLTFQEFFVAAGLHAGERFDELASLHLLEPRWEEILRLGVGYLALVQKRPVAAQRFIEDVLTYEAPAPWGRASKILGRHIGLAALLAIEAGEALPPRAQRTVADAFVAWFCEGSLQDLANTSFLPEHRYRPESWLRQMALSDFGPPVAEAFVRLLRTGTPQGKSWAAYALRVLGARVPSAVITGALEGDPKVQSLAFALLLARNASDEELAALILHSDERTRRMVVETLDDPARRAVRAAILATAATDPSETVRRAAAMVQEGTARIAEGWSGPETPSPEEETRLLPFLRDPDALIRSIALGRLAQSARPDIYAELERLAREDPAGEVRSAALAHWATRGGPAALEEALVAFSNHMDDQAWSFQRGVLAARMDLSWSILPLLATSQSPDVGLRAAAGALLGQAWSRLPADEVSTRASIEAALALLSRDADTTVRRETFRILDASSGWAFDLALAATRDTEPSVRLAAFEAIARRGAHAALAAGLGDPCPEVRAHCLSALVVLEPGERVRRLEAAAGDPSPVVRRAAAAWLNLAGERTDDLVRSLLGDSSPEVRQATAQSIANHDLPAPVPALTPLLDATEPGLQWAAARALALAGDAGMRVLVDHADMPVARAALWVWAERRQWSFPPAEIVDE